MGRKVRISRLFFVIQAVLGLTLVFSPLSGRAQESALTPTLENIASFRLSQAVVRPPEITAYLEILTREGSLARSVTPEQITAFLGDNPLSILDKKFTRFRDGAEGVAYVLLVDVSKSLKKKEFEEMRQVLFAWINGMGENDRAAVVTFGTDVRKVHDFSGDKVGLKEAVAALQPVDDYTRLHQGLVTALELGNRLDKDLPMRRAIITLSDGQDDFAGGMTKEYVLDQLRVDPVPIYALGFSSPPKNPKKEDALKTLGYFARTSGGVYLRGEKDKFFEIFSLLREKIFEVYPVRLRCKTCFWDGREGRLQMDLRYGPLGMTTGLNIKLPPRKIFIDAKIPLPPSPTGTILDRIPWWGYAGAALLLLGLIAMAIVLVQRRQAVPAVAAAGTDYLSPEPYRPPVTPTVAPAFPSYGGGPGELPTEPGEVTASLGAPVAAPKAPAVSKCHIRLTPIRAGEQAKSHEVDLVDKLVVGRSKEKCDLVLPDDSEISKTHCELTYRDGVVHIIDLASTNGTFVNGVPITGKHKLENDDIIGLGKTELRFTVISFEKEENN